MRILLIRHAQTEKNKAGIMQSHNDSEITNEGFEQIKKIISRLKKEKIDAIFCSSLGRAVKTAKEIARLKKLKLTVDDRLKELNAGDFSTLPTKEMLRRWAEYYETKQREGIKRELIRPPNGENSFDHLKRIKSFLRDLIKDYNNKTVVIVGHSGTNKVIIGALKKLDPDDFYSIEQKNACINFLELDSEGNLVKAELNVVDHLR